MGRQLATIAIGFVSGIMSGLFGIGGGVVTTPAIRLFLDAPALVAVGTPLVAIIPSAITGAVSYARKRMADVRAGVILGLSGALTAILGAWGTRLVGGTTVLVATAALIFYVSIDMLLQAFRPPRLGLEAAEEADAVRPPRDIEGRPALGLVTPDDAPHPRLIALVAAGILTGFYSGFLGLGGGFVLVPLLTRWLHFPLKRAIGTSLISIAILSVPATLTHALLGNIDWLMGLALVIGVIPGAALGARMGLGTSEKILRIGFAALLGAVGVWLATSELMGLAL